MQPRFDDQTPRPPGDDERSRTWHMWALAALTVIGIVIVKLTS